jgi:hypothetical protein
MSSWFGIDAAFKVDIIPVLDPVRVEGQPHAHRHHGLV